MSYLNSPEGNIFFDTIGCGPPVLLLHGLSRSSQFWGDFREQLAKSFQVITVDSRGLGQSDKKATWQDSSTDLAQDAILVLDQLGITRCHLIGQSLGGMVALSFAQLAPERILSVTVINASSSGTKTLRLRPMAAFAMLSGLIIRPLLCPLMVYICMGDGSSAKRKKRFASLYKRVLIKEGLPWITVMKQLLTAMRFRFSVEKTLPPVLLLYSEKDRFVPPENSHALYKRIPGAKLQSVPGAGHELPSDNPEALLRAFISFSQEIKDQANPPQKPAKTTPLKPKINS